MLNIFLEPDFHIYLRSEWFEESREGKGKGRLENPRKINMLWELLFDTEDCIERENEKIVECIIFFDKFVFSFFVTLHFLY